MTAAVASPSSVPLLVDGGERERVRRGGKKLSSIFPNRNVFVLRRKQRSSSLSATATSASSTDNSYQPSSSSRSSSTHLSTSCHAALSDYDHCSTSNSRFSTSPLSPQSAWSDDSDEEVCEEDVDELQSAATMSDDDADEQRDVVSPPSSSCSFSSSSSSGSSSSSSSSTSLSPLPTLISPRNSSRARRRLHSKESPAEQKEAHATLPPPSPIVALPPLHPHALSHTHPALPLAHLHVLASSSPSVVGTPPSSYRQQPHQQVKQSSVHTHSPPPSASASSPVKGGKHNRSRSASNQFILLQGGAGGLSPSARSPTTPQTTFVSPLQTSPFTSPLPSPHTQPAPFSPHQHQPQQHHYQHQHHHQHQQHHRQQQHQPQPQQFRHAPPSPLVFSHPTHRSAPHFASPVHYQTSPFLFMSQQSLSSPPSPTPATSMQPPTPPLVPTTLLHYADGQPAGLYMTSPPTPSATTPQSAMSVSPPTPSSAVPHPAAFARPVLTRAASMLDTSSLLHPHPRRSSLLDLAALESSHAQFSKPRSVSSAATFPSFESNSGHMAEQVTSSYPSPTEVHRLLATPLAALLGLTESEPSRSHVPKAVARCTQARNSPEVTAATASLVATTPLSAVELPAEAMPASSVAVLSPLCLHRELLPSVPSSPASYANVAASLPRRLSISSSTSSVSAGSPYERERRLSSSSVSSLPPSPVIKPAPAAPIVALRAAPSPSRSLQSAPIATPSDAPSTQTSATPLLIPSSRQTSQSKLVASGEEAAAESAWHTRKQTQKKQRTRDVKHVHTAAPQSHEPTEQTTSANASTAADTAPSCDVHDDDSAVQVAAALVEDLAAVLPAVDAEPVLEQQPVEALPSPAVLDSAVEQEWTAPAVTTVAACLLPASPVVSVLPDEVSATVGPSKSQLEKKLRPARANRRRASSNANQPPAATDTSAAPAPSCAPVKSSLLCHSWSIRLSMLALHSSLLSAISSLSIASSTALTQHWNTVCTFYSSLFASSASRRRFVSRLRTLSHSTQQQQIDQPAPQPASKARHAHSLRYRHHPLLERQRQVTAKECAAAGGAVLVEDSELLMPRQLVLCMVLCCMFLGTVVVTFLMFNRHGGREV